MADTYNTTTTNYKPINNYGGDTFSPAGTIVSKSPTYGGGSFCPAGTIVLTSNVPEGQCCDGSVSRFLSLAQPGQIPKELKLYVSDAKFVTIMSNVNRIIKKYIKKMKILAVPSVLLWCTLVGVGLLFGGMYGVLRPKTRRKIEEAFAPLTAKGVRIKFVFGSKVTLNRVKITLPGVAART